MDLEQEKYGSIDPKQLIMQNNEDVGKIAADEFSPGKLNISGIEGASHVEDYPIIEGLPPIGAEAENTARQNEVPADDIDRISRQHAGFSMNIRPELTIDDAKEIYYDEAGTEAMAAEVSRRAMELWPIASESLKKELGDQAAASFKAELLSKQAEQKSNEENRKNKERADADTKVQTLIDRLKGGAPIADILPEAPETPEPKPQDESDYEMHSHF